MSLIIRLVIGVLFAVYVTAPLAAMGLLPMTIGTAFGALAFLPAYLQAKKYA